MGKAKGKHDTNHGEKQGSYKSKVNTINSAVLYSKLLYLIKHWWLWIIRTGNRICVALIFQGVRSREHVGKQ